jgi:uncharacterized membrane protein YkvA (DUF1232 family)
VLILTFASLIYLINPTAGILELIPDNIPFIGNIDEGVASFILYSSIEYFKGKPIGFFKSRNK